MSVNDNQNIDLFSIGNLRELQRLSCANCQLKDLSFLNKMPNLRSFFCPDNLIKELAPLKYLEKIQFLDFEINLIEDISVLENIDPKEAVFFSHNRLKKISKVIAKKHHYLKASFSRNFDHDGALLFIQDNPLEFPPPSVIESVPETVKNYYEAAENYDDQHLS